MLGRCDCDERLPLPPLAKGLFDRRFWGMDLGERLRCIPDMYYSTDWYLLYLLYAVIVYNLRGRESSEFCVW
jgi:hypothetical protein